jgi:hypothetical protein
LILGAFILEGGGSRDGSYCVAQGGLEFLRLLSGLEVVYVKTLRIVSAAESNLLGISSAIYSTLSAYYV